MAMHRSFVIGSWLVSLLPLFAVERPSDHAHPRLLFPVEMEAQLREKIAADPLAAELHENILARANAVLRDRTCRYEKSDGKRLLPESRLALHQIMHTAWAWRMTREKKYFDRALAEMEAASAMNDWNPTHFLDTAEMSTAMAIGYDWLYRDLDQKQRDRYAQQIEQKGLRALITRSSPWWTGATNNWSQVCGTGMSFAAIAIDERQPEICADILKQSRRLVEECLRFYQPDGAYPEGPDYWHYGSNYHIMHLAAMEVLFGQSAPPGLWRRSAEFMIHLNGPSGMPFNFADGGLRSGFITPAQTWIASKFSDSSLPGWSRQALAASLPARKTSGSQIDHRFHPLHLLWLPAQKDQQDSISTHARFRGEQEMAFARTAWGDHAAWLAIKGGTGAASHGHLDAGSFVYEAGGVRWFVDLGKENYNLPGYFGKQRWDYFRLNNRSHNTWVIGDALQVAAMPGCPVSDWTPEKLGSTSCEIDLTPAYAKQCARAMRGVTFDKTNGAVSIKDLVEKPVGDLRWAVVTDASVRLDGKSVMLEKNGKRLILSREDDMGGEWREFSLLPPTPEQNKNEGFRMLGFVVARGEELRIHVKWRLATEKSGR